jgi:hypothetical protein
MAPAAVTIDKLIAETKNDKIIQEVLDCLCNGKALDSNCGRQYAKYQMTVYYYVENALSFLIGK